jgi:hypothetical protein
MRCLITAVETPLNTCGLGAIHDQVLMRCQAFCVMFFWDQDFPSASLGFSGPKTEEFPFIVQPMQRTGDRKLAISFP